MSHLLPGVGETESILKRLNTKIATGSVGIAITWILKYFHEELATRHCLCKYLAKNVSQTVQAWTCEPSCQGPSASMY